MGTKKVGNWVLAIALVLSWSAAAEPAGFSELLDRADGVRTTDPERFGMLLDRLEREKHRATKPEREKLRLLLDYRKLVRGEYESAFGDAVALFDQASEPETRFRAALLIANASAATKEFSLGLRYLERALQMREQIVRPEIRDSSLTVAGTLYNQYGQFALGRHFAELALAQNPVPRLQCIAGQIRVEALHGLGEPIDEDGGVDRAIGGCVAEGEVISANFIRSTLARHWVAKGKRQQAIAMLEAHLPEVEATRYSWLIAEFHSLIAKYRMESGDRAGAEEHARIAARFANDGFAESNVVARKLLYEIALERGDLPTALDEYRRYAEAERARLDEIKAREYAFQLSRHELAQKNQSIELLSNQNQLLRLQQEIAQKAAWNSRLAIALLAVVALSLGYWGWRGRRMHHTLRKLAQTDSLTGLSNRRHFRMRSEAMLEQGEQRGRPVSLLLFDLDHFKQINDQCGHAAGDWVLREVARVGRLHCREGDVFGRIGGEEFALTLVDCDLEDAEHVAEQCRRAIGGIDAREAGCTLPVTASIGCVGTSLSGYDYEVLVAHADAAMYQSKVGGRNRVSVYQPAAQAAEIEARREYAAAEVV